MALNPSLSLKKTWQRKGPWRREPAAWVRWGQSAGLTAGFALLYFAPDAWFAEVSALCEQWVNASFDRWQAYGAVYTLVVLVFGLKSLRKHRHNPQQRRRYLTLMAFQTVFAFALPILIPAWLEKDVSFNLDFKLFWPLHSSYFEPNHLDAMRDGGALGRLSLVTGILMFLLVAPWATYKWGKGWYCSWVCGCGALAETAGDSVRHLNQPTQQAWRLERIMIYAVLAWVTLSTTAVLWGYFSGSSTCLGVDIYGTFTKPYAFWVSSLFSGVLGVGFYPLLGNRFWGRYGCPLAAYMGIIQRWKSRFRIEVQAKSCISCGACSAACEMGINVQDYAERGEPIRRASCVGCGLCEVACPRSVLALTTEKQRPEPQPIQFNGQNFQVSTETDVN